MIISKTINKKVKFNLSSKEINNSENIYNFLQILWAKEIDISWWGKDYSTDYTWWRDYYEVPTIVELKM